MAKRTKKNYKKSLSSITSEDIVKLLDEENVIESDIRKILKENSKVYYNELLLHRGVPDGRDGLTDVQRRIVWVDVEENWDYRKDHIKSARLVGQVMGVYHPRGDSSIYGASINMAQPWKNNAIIIDWHGSKGTISGSDAAAMRYTEQRLSKEACFLLTENVKNNSVDFRPNFSQDKTEPCLLPAKIPYLLINGCFGIAAGYVSSIPPHNPNEVIKEMIELIKDPEYEVNILPDFPTGGTLINSEHVKNIYSDFNKFYNTGNSSAKLRATIIKDEDKNLLRIIEPPYMVSGDALMLSIQEATKEIENKLTKETIPPRITGIENIKNISSDNNLEILVYVHKNFDLDTIIAQLYAHTLCQKTEILSFFVTKGEEFKEVKNIKELFTMFLDFRRVTIKRIKNNLIREYKLRIHILEGLIKILDPKLLDKVIKDIRKSNNRSEVIKMLKEKYDLTNIQAEYVSNYKLYQLANMEIQKLIDEKEDKENKVEEEVSYFRDKNKLRDYMIKEYEEILEKYFPDKKYKRKTKLENISISSDEEKMLTIPDKDFMIITTKFGYIKKIEKISSQKRNTKGILVGKLKNNDYVTSINTLNSRDQIFIFTEKGKVFKEYVFNIPTCNTTNLGYNITSRINGDKIVSMIPVSDNDSDSTVFMIATERNLIKLVPIHEFANIFKTGIIASKLKDNDKVLSVEKLDINNNESIIALNSLGDAIRVSCKDIPLNKRTTYGSNLFWSKLIDEGGYVTSVSVVNTSKKYYFVITKNGLGKKMDISEFECQNRNTKGKMICKLKENDKAIKLLSINEEDDILIVSNKKIVNIKGSDIRTIGRTTYGCSIKKCDDDEYIIDCSN